MGGLPARRDAQQRDARNFRLFGPDETASNRLSRRVRGRPTAPGMPTILPDDDHLAPRRPGDGDPVASITCQGWLEGYLLTGRHGLFSCYEAFIHIVDSMFNQHAKWLKTCARDSLAPADRVAELPAHLARLAAGPQRLQPPGPRLHRPRRATRRPTSCASICRRTPTRCCAVTDHCLRSWNRVNVIVAGKQPAPQWLDMDAAVEALHRRHRHLGMGEQRPRRRARRGDGLRRRRADAGDAGRGRCCCDSRCRSCRIRVVNVVDLMTLQPQQRASARPDRPRLRRAVHHGQAGDLRLSRLSVADPPADLPAHQPRQPPCARLQGGGHDDDAVRHGGAERSRPVPPGGRRDRPACRSSATAVPMPSRRCATS